MNLLERIKALGLRKMALTFYMFNAMCGLVWFHKLDGALFAECVKILIASACAANAAEHFAKKEDAPAA